MNHQIVINNQLISYLQNKPAGKTCLLFLHGWRSQKEVWDQAIQRIRELENKGISLYALDLPGFGGSPAPKNPHPSRPFDAKRAGHLLPKGEGGWDVADYAEVVKGFIEKLELKNIIIVGHSFGGRIGIKLAAKYPELISKLLLVDSAGFTTPSARKNAMATIAKIAKPFFKPKFMQGLRTKIYKKIGAEDYVATPELQKTFINITTEDLTEDLKRIKIPTLIIWGEKDQETPLEFGQKMNSLILNSKFLILKNVGHFSFFDRPEEFAKSIIEFVN